MEHLDLKPGAVEALEKRYGMRPAVASRPWNETIARILNPRSVRSYKPDPVPPGTLEVLVAAAQSAPTSSNYQAWSVMEVTDPALRKEIATIANNQRHVERCPLFLVWLADLSRLDRIGQADGINAEGLDYVETFIVATVDAALAAQNVVVAAESLGLATLYIGAVRNDIGRIAKLLNLPPRVYATFGMCIGYEDKTVKSAVKPRLPQSVIVHHNSYGVPDEAARIAAFDRINEEFARSNGMTVEPWARKIMARIATAKSLHGRELISGVLKALGFPLR